MRQEIIRLISIVVTKVIHDMCYLEVNTLDSVDGICDYSSDDIIVKLELFGDIKRGLCIRMNNDMALKVISKMMMRDVQEIDYIGESALCELGNMIGGNFSTMLYVNGLTEDVTVPSYMKGDECDMFLGMEMSSLPVQTVEGNLFVDVIDLL